MADLMISLIIGGALIGVFVFIKGRLQDYALREQLTALEVQARATLAPADYDRLGAQMDELHLAGFKAIQRGMSPKAASRATKRAGIQTIIGFMEIDRMFSSSAQPVPPSTPPRQPTGEELARRSADLEKRIASFHTARVG